MPMIGVSKVVATLEDGTEEVFTPDDWKVWGMMVVSPVEPAKDKKQIRSFTFGAAKEEQV